MNRSSRRRGGRFRGAVIRVAALGVLSACATPKVEHLVVLHLNDFHGQIQPRDTVPRPGFRRQMGGFPAVDSYVGRVRDTAAADTVLWLTSGGDWYQGTPEGNEDRGSSVMACRNRLGFTAATVGNHEFDFGEENVARLATAANHPVLAANILDRSGDLRDYVRPYHLVTLGRVRVAILGLITSRTRFVSTGPFGEAEFADEIETVRTWLPKLRDLADVVILLTHCGIEVDEVLARTFPSIPLILGGHSHTPLPRGKRVGDTWIAQSGGRGTAISRIEVRLDQGRRRLQVESVQLVPLPATEAQPDPDRAAFLGQTFRHIGPKWDRPVGIARGVPHAGARTLHSTAGGNYVAGLIRRSGAADVGLANKGGIRARLPLGPITRRQVFQFLPFDNTVVTFAMTGAQLRETLERGLRPGRLPLEIAGARYGYRFRDGARELAFVEVGGVPVDPAARYRVATNSFLAKGGDEFEVFAGLPVLGEAKGWLRDRMLAELGADAAGVLLPGEQRISVVE